MARALGLVERVIRDPSRDEGVVVVIAGAVAVEADFPGCLGRKGMWLVRGVGSLGKGKEEKEEIGDERRERTSRERNHLIPLGRKVCLRPRLQDPFIENPVAGLRLGFFLHRTADLLHPTRSHEIGIPLVGLVDVDLLERALGVVAPTEVLHLCQHLDHRREAEDGRFFGVEVDEAVAEAGAVGEVVFGVREIFFMTGRAVLES